MPQKPMDSITPDIVNVPNDTSSFLPVEPYFEPIVDNAPDDSSFTEPVI